MNNTTSSLGPLLVTDPANGIPYLFLTVLAISVGVFGNSLVLFVYLTCKELRKTGNEFIVNLAIADLCVTGLADPMCILGAVKGEDFFVDRPWLCHLIACLCLTACFCAFLSLTAVTLHRYIFICHHQLHNVLFRRRSVNIISCVLLWFVALGLEAGNFLGWGGHVFDRKNHSCIWDRVASMSYTIIVGVVFITGPLCLIGVSHFCIFRHIRRAKVKVFMTHGDQSDQATKKKAWRETIRSSRTLFIVFCAFVICWSPYTAVILLDLNDQYPFELHLWVTWLAHMHSALNFVIYCISHSPFRKCLRQCFKCVLCFKTPNNSEQPQNSSQKETNIQTLSARDTMPQNRSPCDAASQKYIGRGPYGGTGQVVTNHE